MAINKELKQFIDKRYDEKMSIIDMEKLNQQKLNIEEYFENDDDFQTALKIQEQILELTNKIPKKYLLIYKVQPMVKRPIAPDEIKYKNTESFDKKLAELKKEKELIILKISLEKKFEKIQEILKEVGIEM